MTPSLRGCAPRLRQQKVGTFCEGTAAIWVKKHEASKLLDFADTGGPMRLCFVLLPAPKPLLATPMEKALKDFPELGELVWSSAPRDGVSRFTVGGIEVQTALMPMPVPNGEADEATERSLSGAQGSWVLPEHRAHLAVVQQRPTRGKQKLAELTTFTRIVAAIVRATRAVGVYWGDSGATHHPEFVVNMAQTDLPLPVWVGLSIASTGKVTELLSIGMGQLGLPDLLVVTPKVDSGVVEFFYDLLAYVARRGKKLPEGDSVGRTEKEKLKVRYVPSPVDPKTQVWSVRLPAKKKPAGKKKKR